MSTLPSSRAIRSCASGMKASKATPLCIASRSSRMCFSVQRRRASSGVGRLRTSKRMPYFFSSTESVFSSAPETRLMAVPFLPMRPVRPTRCRYTAGSSGSE